jgi:3-methyladenine DNA glycosylase/8-oxoguanine DNA glycosylase
MPEAHTPPHDLRAIEDELARRLGLTVNIDGYEKIWESDPILSRLPDEMRGARPASPFSLYEFLVICTVLQNTTVRRTTLMASALAHNLGRAYRFPDGTILHGFCEPADLVQHGEARLRELRLGYRAKSLVRFSEQFRTQPDMETELLGLRTDPDRLRARAKEIYGVGPASAAYIMFEWFKCIDEFNHVSPWERKILSKLLFGSYDTPAMDIIRFCRNRWAPYTMLAVHAVFEAVFWRRVQGQGPEWLDELIRL